MWLRSYLSLVDGVKPGMLALYMDFGARFDERFNGSLPPLEV